METIQFWRTAGDKIVMTNGCFDIIHRGHIKLLEEARKMGDRLIVAINSDASVKRLKGNERPINTEEDRAYVLSSLKAVDAVVIFDPHIDPFCHLSKDVEKLLSQKAKNSMNEAPMTLLQMIKPDIQVKGGDYRQEDVPEAIFASELKLVQLEEGYSTTKIIYKVQE